MNNFTFIKRAYTLIELLSGAAIPIAGGLSFADNYSNNPDETMKNIVKSLGVGAGALVGGAVPGVGWETLTFTDANQRRINSFKKNIANDTAKIKHLNKKLPKLRAILHNIKKTPRSALATLLGSTAAGIAIPVMGSSLSGYGIHKLLKNNKDKD